MKQDPTFLFLCGVGRSGTTTLRTSLGTHPQIYYNGRENNVIQDVAEVAARNCSMKSRKNAMVVDQTEYDSRFRALLSSIIWPDQQLASRPVHMAAINPTPRQLDYLVQLFPNSKFVGLVRHGIEVVSSRMEFTSFADNEFETHCDVWNRSAEVAQWGRHHSAAFRLMRHEWFYEPGNLKAWMRDFCKWLAIDFSAAPEQKILSTLTHPTSAKHAIDHREFSGSTNEDRQNYFLSKRNRWRNWTPQQLSQFEDRCCESMRKLNYRIPWMRIETYVRKAG